jgi:16S rRNA C967 or C1407 C5-methylase (RsmB/RsmF family)/NOL1/NOP2/fmu family ribosome biogenesis protein
MYFPEQFITRSENYFGEEVNEFLKSLSKEAFISIRLNPRKPNHNFDNDLIVPWCNEGRYLSQRAKFTLDPLFHAGTYYVQEASSMFISHLVKNVLDLSKPQKVLDLCAAPGGKSTLLATLMSDDSLLVSNEAIHGRVGVLQENMIKWCSSNVMVSNNDPDDFKRLPSFFDLVLADAPCSGEGLFRKDHEAINHWSLKNIHLCEARQKRILETIKNSIAENGYLVYCTCTYSVEENEENIKWFVKNNPEFETVQIPINKDWGIAEKENSINDKKFYSYHFHPHKVRGEGFFIACLRKTGKLFSKEDRRCYFKTKKNNKHEFVKEKDKIIFKEWIKNHERFEYLVDDKGEIHAIDKEKIELISILSQALKIKLKGIYLGKLISRGGGEAIIPSHHLAMSNIISDKIPSIQLTKEQALQYLAKQNIILDLINKSGWYLVQYQNTNLGWVKVLPNRINNYYPQEFRIRKRII